MSFGPNFGNNPNVQYWLSDEPLTADSQIPTEGLVANTGFAAGASFTTSATSQNIVAGHIYSWNGSIWVDVAQVSSMTGNISTTGTLTAGTGITSTTGNISATAGAVSAGTTMTAGTGITATTGNISATAGAVNAGTSMAATLGNITATNGNLVLGTAGNKLSIATGSNASIGTSAAMTAGTIIISTTAVTTSSKIFLSANTPGGTPGVLSAPSASIVNGTSFVINSTSNTDTSTVNWWIVS